MPTELASRTHLLDHDRSNVSFSLRPAICNAHSGAGHENDFVGCAHVRASFGSPLPVVLLEVFPEFSIGRSSWHPNNSKRMSIQDLLSSREDGETWVDDGLEMEDALNAEDGLEK